MLLQEKQAFIEQTKIVSQAEIENRILKNYHREALANIKYEMNKIFSGSKYDKRKPLAGRINQSDSVHINPAFGGDSDRINAKSQNSFLHNNSDFNIEESKDHLRSNFIHNFQNPSKKKIENSGMAGINISGTTGGDDESNLKLKNNLRKVDRKEIKSRVLKQLNKVQQMISKYQNTPFNDIFDSKKRINGKYINCILVKSIICSILTKKCFLTPKICKLPIFVH